MREVKSQIPNVDIPKHQDYEIVTIVERTSHGCKFSNGIYYTVGNIYSAKALAFALGYKEDELKGTVADMIDKHIELKTELLVKCKLTKIKRGLETAWCAFPLKKDR